MTVGNPAPGNAVKMGRKFFVGGNWKMNGDKASIDKIVDFLKAGPLDPNTGTCLSAEVS